MIQIQHNGFPLKTKTLRRLVKEIAGQLPLRGAVTIKIAAADEVRTLNKKYRGQDRVTDVLSFSLDEKLPGGFYAGDILICWTQAEKQARENGHSLQKELLLLIIHGLLHLQGHDHEKDKGDMLARQRQLFAAYSGELE
ncbi:MAG: rRNA maturation RNase YbeY [Candidatus Aminicenantes bacterium]|nr:rRNA maturation RNase YbeY [Candidatus Aminicenantes bacterium]